ncbi:MAG: carboxypeptidase-like regulatory domain-containing protein [Bacteroidota bacterium]|nr:hypothetical protein [Odoribacter sp.]MDP3644882.1 carboxypeptidase-like regulatory domain-containing protein [Bacteroidota bacterium]
MRKIILMFLFISLSLVAYNQVIKGTVYDQKTHEAIYSATVYFNGTTVGTLTDEKGNFTLDVTKNAPMPVTVSMLGYNSTTLNSNTYSTGNPLIIHLTPKVYELNEFVVKAKPHARDRKYNLFLLFLFKNEFLGTSANAQNCDILNEEDITFNYGSDRDTLKAFASKPLQIINRKLGYKITYYLDKFEYYKRNQSFLYKGNLIFNEDMAINDPQKPVIERRRKNAFRGSRMHFFRSLWKNDLKSTGFVVYNLSNDFLDYQDIVVEDDKHRKFLAYKKYLGICYYSKITTSHIKFIKDEVFFDKSGYFDESGITWDGKMASQRIGDQLPYDYIEK